MVQVDTIYGGLDDDTIFSSTGNDTIYGGDGLDTFDLSARTGKICKLIWKKSSNRYK